MSEKVECKSKDCKAMILPSTAERTGGMCMTCKQKADRLEHEKYIRENIKDVDPFEGVSDRVEILKIIHQPKKRDPLINYLPYKKTPVELYEELSEHEIARLIKFVIDNMHSDDKEVAGNIINEIAAFTNTDLSKIHQKYIEMREYYPGYIFRGAEPDIAAKLIHRINIITESQDIQLELNHILEALAWVGTHNVISQFSEWSKSPPKWRNALHIPPENYAHCAGWELNNNFERRELILEECYPLIRTSKSSSIGPVETCKEGKDSCKWCGRAITNMFEFNLTEKLFDFIPFSGSRLTIATCEVCSAYGDNLYMEVGPEGDSTWSSYNEKPEYLPDANDDYDRLPVNKLRLSTKPRLLYHSVDWCLPISFSQVGGMPSWIQDSAYGNCPRCNKGMVFIAQLSVEDVEDYGEGIFYGLLCPDCSITTVRYQQT